MKACSRCARPFHERTLGSDGTIPPHARCPGGGLSPATQADLERIQAAKDAGRDAHNEAVKAAMAAARAAQPVQVPPLPAPVEVEAPPAPPPLEDAAPAATKP